MPYQDREDESRLSLPSLSLPAKKSGIAQASNLTGRVLTGPMQKRTAREKPAKALTLDQARQNIAGNSTLARSLDDLPKLRQPAEPEQQRYDPALEAIKKMAATRNPQPVVAQPSPQQPAQQPAQPAQPAQSYDPGFEALRQMAFTRNPQPNVVPQQQPPPVAPTFPGPGQQPPQAQAGAGIGALLGPGANVPNVPSLNQPTAPQIIPAQQGTDQFSQVQPNANGALLQPEGVIQPPTQNGQVSGAGQSASLQRPQNIIPEGSVEIIRGRPGGGGNAGAGGFQVNYATPNGRGGFAPEIAAPPSPVIQGQAAQAFNQRGTAQGVQAQTNLASIANPAAQGVVQQEVLNQRTFDAKAQALQAEQAQLNQPEVKTITDEYGAEKLVVFDKKTGTQKDVKDASKPTIASVMRELKAEFPDATDEEIEAFYQSMQGQ